MATENNNKTLNVPNLRFPEFSGEWEKFRNDSLFNVVSEKNKGKQITSVLSASQTDGMVSRDSLGIDIKFEEDSIKNYKIVREGDYVIHLRSFQGGFAFSDRVGVCSPAYTILRPTQQISYGFLKPFFMSNKFIDSLRLVTYGIRDGKSISVEEWLKLSTSLPSVEEQKKISAFLSLLAERIATQIKIIEDLKKLKSAISKILFDHCERASNIRLLGDICKITTGKLDANAMTDDGKYPFFTCAREDYKTDTFAFEGDSLLISGNGEIGIVKRYNGKFNAYQRTYVLQNFSENIEYLMYYIEYHLPRRVLKEKNVGAMPYIVLSTLSNMPIKIPDIKEQCSVCRTLTCLSELIELNSKLRTSYISQKSYLLAQMFI